MTLVKTTYSCERGMNPVAMTIINPQKECWTSQGSNQRPPVLKSAMLPTELLGLVFHSDQEVKKVTKCKSEIIVDIHQLF